MPEQQHGMKQTHGGDDTGGETPPQAKKPSLGKYVSAPDVNVRDLFWRIMAAYTAHKGQSIDVTPYNGNRTALVRIAWSVLENPESAYHGLSPNFTARYTLLMVLDGEWEGMFGMLLEEGASAPAKTRARLIKALQHLLKQEKYRARLTDYFERALKNLSSAGAVLAYLVELKDITLINALKKWLMVIAQTDIEANQIYAIGTLALIQKDEEVQRMLLRLLSHWDPQTRKAVATLFGHNPGENAVTEANRQLQMETDPEVRKLLEKITQKKKKRVEGK